MRYTGTMRVSVSTVRLWLLAVVVFGGAIALQPSLGFNVFHFPSLRVGVYQLATVGLVCCSLPLWWHALVSLRKRCWVVVAAGLLSLSLAIGMLSSQVPGRTALYTISLLYLLLTGLAAAVTYQSLSQQQRARLMTIGLWSGVVCGIAAVSQLLAASFHPTAFGTLCSGCHAGVFGFPRVNLLAAEPQFLASSLLPSLWAGFCFRNNRRVAAWSVFWTSLAIGLTFSRGAFVAIIAASILYLLVLVWRYRQPADRPGVKKSLKSFTACSGIMLAGIVVSFSLLLLSATIRYHDTPHITYRTAASMLDQLSLGVLKLPAKTEPPASPPAQSTTPPPATGTKHFQPSGFVAASSNDRLSAADLAVRAWLDSPKTIVFGVGLANLGSFIQQTLHQPASLDQTVYIFYILLLSSIGLLGLLPLLAIALWALIQAGRHIDHPSGRFGFLLTSAFLIHFWFFGSLINSVHCFAWIGVFLYNYRKNHAEKL